MGSVGYPFHLNKSRIPEKAILASQVAEITCHLRVLPIWFPEYGINLNGEDWEEVAGLTFLQKAKKIS
jgi:hypothetical protein